MRANATELRWLYHTCRDFQHKKELGTPRERVKIGFKKGVQKKSAWLGYTQWIGNSIVQAEKNLSLQYRWMSVCLKKDTRRTAHVTVCPEPIVIKD